MSISVILSTSFVNVILALGEYVIDDLKFITQKEIKAQLENSDMTTIKYKRCYVHNIFTTNHRWLVAIGSNLNLTLRLLFYPNNNNQ